MKFKSQSRYHSRLPAALILLIMVAAIFIFLSYRKRTKPIKIVNTAIDGINLTYLDFDKNNQKKIEIKCLESQKQSDDRLLMKKITATFFKTAKLEKDIHDIKVVGDSGFVSANLYNFDIRGHARIFSSDFSLSSQSFYLENRELLSTKEGVDFKLKNISGRAAAGLEYFLNQNILKLFASKGTWIRNSQPYEFQTQTLWVIKKSNLIILQRNADLAGAGATARGDWMSLQFDSGFANLQAVSISGNCYFNMVERGKNGRSQRKEISANFIYIAYDPEGRLRQITVHDAGKINLIDQKNSGQIASDNTEIFLRSENQTLEKVQVLTRGTLTSRGRDNLTVSGDTLAAFYSQEGLLTEIKAEKKCEFSTDDFRGTAAAINYDAVNFLIDIAGKDAAILSKKNLFNSSSFLIHTKRRQLNSDKGVKATIIPEKKSVLLSRKPLFITAAGMEMTDKGNVIRFKEKVKLFQDDVELYAGEMLFDGPRNRISCQGSADLKFFNENEAVVLRGQTISFDTPERKIVVTGNARLNQAENILGGQQIELSFGLTNQLEMISALGNVTFSKKDLSGQSQLLHWDFNKKIVLFKDSAQITRKDAGTTKGKELLLNLSSYEIKVSSQEDRAETVINQKRP
ncbi:MAG: LptA/OstA family protein [Chrysiogenales bacterium]